MFPSNDKIITEDNINKILTYKDTDSWTEKRTLIPLLNLAKDKGSRL
jgi:hypothetical protein